MNQTLDQLLHDADRAQGGISLARMMRDRTVEASLEAKAIGLYQQALDIDPTLSDPAWKETGNRDRDWLRARGFAQIAEVEGYE